MNAEKQLRLACRREIPVVVQYERDGQRRQTEPVKVDFVTPDGDVWLLRRRGIESTFIVNASEVTLVHPQIEE